MVMFSPDCANNGGGSDALNGGAAMLCPSQTFVPGEISRRRDCKFDATSAKVLKDQRLLDRLCILGDRK